jgi:hypothetical protein
MNTYLVTGGERRPLSPSVTDAASGDRFHFFVTPAQAGVQGGRTESDGSGFPFSRE